MAKPCIHLRTISPANAKTFRSRISFLNQRSRLLLKNRISLDSLYLLHIILSSLCLMSGRYTQIDLSVVRPTISKTSSTEDDEDEVEVFNADRTTTDAKEGDESNTWVTLHMQDSMPLDKAVMLLKQHMPTMRPGAYDEASRMILAYVHQFIESEQSIRPALPLLLPSTTQSTDTSHAELRRYTNASLCQLLLEQLPWLLLNMVLLSFGANITRYFEHEIARFPIVREFIPCLIGTVGNAGSQPAMWVRLALTTGLGSIRPLCCKEMILSVFKAICLGTALFVLVIAENPTQWTSAGTLGVAMFLSVLLAVILSLVLTVAFHAIKCCNVSDGVLPTLFTLNDDLAILVVCGLAVGMSGGGL